MLPIDIVIQNNIVAFKLKISPFIFKPFTLPTKFQQEPRAGFPLLTDKVTLSKSIPSLLTVFVTQVWAQGRKNTQQKKIQYE